MDLDTQSHELLGAAPVPAPTAAQAAATAGAAADVGLRLEVFWPAEGAWYGGVITHVAHTGWGQWGLLAGCWLRAWLPAAAVRVGWRC